MVGSLLLTLSKAVEMDRGCVTRKIGLEDEVLSSVILDPLIIYLPKCRGHHSLSDKVFVSSRWWLLARYVGAGSRAAGQERWP